MKVSQSGLRRIFEQIMEINLTKVIGWYMLYIFNTESLTLHDFVFKID